MIDQRLFWKHFRRIFLLTLLTITFTLVFYYNQFNLKSFTVPPWTSLKSFGDFEKEEKANLNRPRGITKDNNNNIYIADTNSNKIKVFTPDGEFIKEFLHQELIRPVDLAYYKNKLYITLPSSEKPEILVFDLNGQIKEKFAIDKIVPTGIDVNEEGIYITDIYNQQILLLNFKGEIQKKFGQPGRALGQFAYPNDILVVNDKIFVSDSNNSRVQVFDKNNFKFLYTLPRVEAQIKLGLPIGLGFYNNKIFVVDALLNNIHIFDEKGNRIKVFGLEGVEEGQFLYPSNVLLFDKKMYVTNSYNNRVEIFSVE